MPNNRSEEEWVAYRKLLNIYPQNADIAMIELIQMSHNMIINMLDDNSDIKDIDKYKLTLDMIYNFIEETINKKIIRI